MPSAALEQALDGLPIAPLLPEIGERLRDNHLVLSAETGSGKTTGVPLALLDADWLRGRSILMLEPRRPAARMAAARMAALRGEQVGASVGDQIKLASAASRPHRTAKRTWLQCPTVA
jgi:ATP-dependent helicase HrpB